MCPPLPPPLIPLSTGITDASVCEGIHTCNGRSRRSKTQTTSEQETAFAGLSCHSRQDPREIGPLGFETLNDPFSKDAHRPAGHTFAGVWRRTLLTPSARPEFFTEVPQRHMSSRARFARTGQRTRLVHLETRTGSQGWRLALRHVGVFSMECGQTLVTTDPRPGIYFLTEVPWPWQEQRGTGSVRIHDVGNNGLRCTLLCAAKPNKRTVSTTESHCVSDPETWDSPRRLTTSVTPWPPFFCQSARSRSHR